ncbi:MAG: response regulator [Beijerinckiaceae bacterium]
MPRVLLIEDDVRLAGMVADYLRAAGLEAAHAATGGAGLAELQRGAFDLVLLDLMLPDGDGLDIFRRIRELRGPSAQTPVIMLTARGDPLDKVVGLEIGAEDYVAKPFEPRELLARVRVVLRRSQQQTPPRTPAMRFGRLEIDPEARAVRIDGSEKQLTSRQFDLLAAMAQRAGRVLTREQLADLVGGDAQAYDPALDRSIDVHIARLRSTIEDDPKNPRRIITVRGAGYVFAKVQDEGRG